MVLCFILLKHNDIIFKCFAFVSEEFLKISFNFFSFFCAIFGLLEEIWNKIMVTADVHYGDIVCFEFRNGFGGGVGGLRACLTSFTKNIS